MHLLAALPGQIADGSEAVDLGQSPGEIVVLSSADTELALLAAAQARRRAQDPATPSLRLAPILRLGHNFSVDLYMERVADARLVIARVLGGSGYWAYGVERLVETCRAHRIPLALLPGDEKPDAELAELSSVTPASRRRLWRYLAEGGPGNAGNFLRYAGSLIGRESEWAEPAPLLRAGYYWPDRALPSFAEIAGEWRGTGGVAADHVLPGARPVRQHRTGGGARPGARGARLAAAAGFRRQPQGRGGGGAPRRCVRRRTPRRDPQRHRLFGS